MRYTLGLSATALVTAAVLGAFAARGETKGETVAYKHGDVELEGYLTGPASGKADYGVLIVHEWWGHDDYVRRRADQLAELGYAAFALDMYGKGKHTDDAKVAGEWSGKVKGDRALMRARAQAGLDQLKNSKWKPKACAAIGYCFGGTTVLELARGGADVKGVVSFHGGLDTPNPDDAKNAKAKFLVCHGGADGFVPDEQVVAFENEMRKGGCDWQLLVLGGASHSFTNKGADAHKIPGLTYSESADRRSWQAMQSFFKEIFGG